MKRGRHKITFLDPADIECVTLAQLGMSNEVIQEHAHLTPGQIQYRITKAKNLDGLPAGMGYRKQWRTGKSEVAQTILGSIVPVINRENKKRLPKQIVHPTPEVSPHK